MHCGYEAMSKCVGTTLTEELCPKPEKAPHPVRDTSIFTSRRQGAVGPCTGYSLSHYKVICAVFPIIYISARAAFHIFIYYIIIIHY